MSKGGRPSIFNEEWARWIYSLFPEVRSARGRLELLHWNNAVALLIGEEVQRECPDVKKLVDPATMRAGTQTPRQKVLAAISRAAFEHGEMAAILATARLCEDLPESDYECVKFIQRDAPEVARQVSAMRAERGLGTV